MRLYLDASVLVPLFVTEARSSVMAAIVNGLTVPPLVSNFAAGEYSSAIARRFRMAQLSANDASDVLEAFDAWSVAMAQPLEIEAHDIGLAAALVRRFDLKLRLPDAIHLAACQRRGLTLATLDDMLADAARALGVAHIVPA